MGGYMLCDEVSHLHVHMITTFQEENIKRILYKTRVAMLRELVNKSYLLMVFTEYLFYQDQKPLPLTHFWILARSCTFL